MLPSDLLSGAAGRARDVHVLPHRDSPTSTWINVTGVHDESIVRRIGEHFGLHPLVQKDIAHTGQRPRPEMYDDHVYLVSEMLYHDGEDHHLRAEQVSFVLGRNYLTSFQEKPGDVFEPVRERLRKGGASARRERTISRMPCST
ncbi:MAG: hypothetical protein BRD55_02500 [Bacteroidetes bacterium SW_9_63_38]|nr:MAG: hypothetical protein BRD55_02500 [Bacteroidetes bacterium SW_9_63_38]